MNTLGIVFIVAGVVLFIYGIAGILWQMFGRE